ncbi:hypothetical protein QQS21_001190 [Conoideocrella luteorostrata]|uniref:NmrA-like domain-containing protein n=1 Tax=Conoideocrella luteorostrata TaxID=1105319 RepID=A0AAJ0CZY9_9HYPO|nr:hypothetical protein QQS21_001190 [Conoideocrella luteorostrata]
MAHRYAKDQPAGFTNRIERVAIIGTTGQVGSHVTAALASTGKHTITAITRKDSKSKQPEGVKVVPVDYDDEDSLTNALKGQQFLMISLAVTAPKDLQAKIIKAAAKAGVPWVMPNGYGTNVFDEKLAAENLTGPSVLSGVKSVEDESVSSWVLMCCSFWYEFSLAMGPGWYGLSFPNKKITFIDDGKTRINTSTWEQCGRAMKALLSLNELPEDENDTSVTLSNWRNKPLYISSFLMSQRDMLDSVHRVMGTTDADWTIEYEPHEERYQRGMEIMKKGEHLGFGICLYTRTFYPNGGGNFEATQGLANDLLGLPKEDVDEATKRAVAMAEGGFKR